MTQNGSSRHLLLIDGLNVVRRVYEAVPAPDSLQKAQGALRASIGSLRRALAQHEPSHVLAAFDFGGHTWRHALYPAYRAQRKPMPEPLAQTLPEILEHVQKLGVRTVRIAEVEADDVIAMVCQKWLTAGGGKVTVLSTDKDLTSLIAFGARVFDHFSETDRDEAWVRNKFGVSSQQLLDLLALTGDATDGVPGIPGVGVKTAARWLGKFGSLQNLLLRAEEIQGKIGESLRAHIEQVKLARQLVSFKTDMTLGLSFESLRYQVQ